MKTKDVEIDWNSEKKIVKVKRLTTGEKNRYYGKITAVKVISGREEVTVDVEKLRNAALIMGIAEAPFTIDEVTIGNLDPEITEPIFEAFQELNQTSLK